MSFNLKQLNVMIIEEESVLSSSIKNSLKIMGFDDQRIHRAPSLVSFNRLIKKCKFHLIICHYAVKRRPIGRKYHHIYRQCKHFTNECSFIYLTEKVQNNELVQIEELHPDSIIEIPFNHNQFKTIISDSLKKRRLLSVIFNLINSGELNQAAIFCEKFSQKDESLRIDLFRVLIEHYISCEKYDVALAFLEQLNSKYPCDWFLLKTIEINSIIGNMDTALSLANEYEILGYPHNSKISEITAYKSILDSDLDSALETIKNIAKRYPYLVDVTINLAYLYIASNDLYNAYMALGKVKGGIELYLLKV